MDARAEHDALASGGRAPKDDALAAIAGRANVAQFISFGPGAEPAVRHRFLREPGPDGDVDHAVSDLLARAGSGSVNIRSFLPGKASGNPFAYGLRTAPRALAEIRRLASDGYHTIVNETIDVEDGGVSGVRWNGWTEFAPEDTPRCVEHPGTAGLPAAVADDVFDLVYGIATPLPDIDPSARVEFSLHPRPVGLRRERSIVWEVADTAEGRPGADGAIDWPNRFSRFLGDKAFGLLLADVLGLAVPRALVIARTIAPFTIGRPTGSEETWVRTCPRTFSPGKYPTYPHWVDVFALLAAEDPDGTALGSVLVQHGVDATHSGSVVLDGALPEVRGVRGAGDEYMAGSVADVRLPRHVVGDAVRLYAQAAALVGPCRIEWVHDGEAIWLVQLNRDRSEGFSLTRGDAASWVRFDPRDGVDALVALLDTLDPAQVGVELTRRVGLTSHIGDVLRSGRVAVRLKGDKGAAERLAQGALW